MKTLVLYTSMTGSTEKYAHDIANAVGGEAFSLKTFSWRKIDDYGIVIYGGWIMGGTIQGLNKFFQHWDKSLKNKNVIIFSVGMTIPTAEGRHLLIEQNLLDLYHVRYYQVRGSFDINKLHFPYKFMINNSIKMAVNDPNASEDQKSLALVKDHPIEVYDNEKIEKILTVVRSIESAPVEVKEESK